MILKQQTIMNIGVSDSGISISENMVRNSADSFRLVPIIFNKDQSFKNYNDLSNYFDGEVVIGYTLLEPNINIKENNVFADICIFHQYSELWKGKFENWCIEFDDDINDKFKLISIEVF